jgi:cation diffusion facilitator CzcD-associated flavoprotein CzcO
MNGSSPVDYSVLEQPLGSARPVRIAIIGAGASGINMIRALRLGLKNYEVVVYEKNEEVGGTWFENRYPGCRCDVPSHNYQFSWRPNKEWSNFFAPAEEIYEYLNRVCDEEDMRGSIKTMHQIVKAAWDEAKGVWGLEVQDLRTGQVVADEAHFLLNGGGILK